MTAAQASRAKVIAAYLAAHSIRIATLIVAIIPLIVVLIDWLRPGGRRPRARVMIGVLIGFAGLALLVGLNGEKEINLAGVGVSLVGSLAWSMQPSLASVRKCLATRSLLPPCSCCVAACV